MFLLMLSACKYNAADQALKMELLTVPEGFPEIEFPADNPFTVAKWKLGKKLFYDNRLSRDRSTNCGSCHFPPLAFADKDAKSMGFGNLRTERNSPSIANIAYHPYFTRAGGVPTLEMQVLVPLESETELNFDIPSIVDRLKDDVAYQEMSQKAFKKPLDAYVITRAISTFERTIISGSSSYDKFITQGERLAMNELEVKGMDLFFSERTNCSKCHSGFNFTNYELLNNGLYKDFADVGKYELTLDSTDIGKFKVPSLRNVALTPPYMHDGSLPNLESVIDHYTSGGKNHPNQSPDIKPIDLTVDEKAALILFLESLSDDHLTTNSALSNF